MSLPCCLGVRGREKVWVEEGSLAEQSLKRAINLSRWSTNPCNHYLMSKVHAAKAIMYTTHDLLKNAIRSVLELKTLLLPTALSEESRPAYLDLADNVNTFFTVFKALLASVFSSNFGISNLEVQTERLLSLEQKNFLASLENIALLQRLYKQVFTLLGEKGDKLEESEIRNLANQILEEKALTYGTPSCYNEIVDGLFQEGVKQESIKSMYLEAIKPFVSTIKKCLDPYVKNVLLLGNILIAIEGELATEILYTNREIPQDELREVLSVNLHGDDCLLLERLGDKIFAGLREGQDTVRVEIPMRTITRYLCDILQESKKEFLGLLNTEALKTLSEVLSEEEFSQLEPVSNTEVVRGYGFLVISSRSSKREASQFSHVGEGWNTAGEPRNIFAIFQQLKKFSETLLEEGVAPPECIRWDSAELSALNDFDCYLRKLRDRNDAACVGLSECKEEWLNYGLTESLTEKLLKHLLPLTTGRMFRPVQFGEVVVGVEPYAMNFLIELIMAVSKYNCWDFLIKHARENKWMSYGISYYLHGTLKGQSPVIGEMPPPPTVFMPYFGGTNIKASQDLKLQAWLQNHRGEVDRKACRAFLLTYGETEEEIDALFSRIP